MNIPFFKFESSEREIELVTEVLKSGWLTTAKMAAKLEESFKERCKTEYALAVNSCTAGLHLALEALGVREGDKVIVPSLTFTASAEVIRYLGAHPVFVDVDPDTLLVRLEDVKKAHQEHPDVKSVVVVHFGGQSCELDGEEGIYEYCKENGISLVQDAAHAFPSYDTYGPVGSLGDITCFSFYANKTMTTGEGGMVVTNDSEIASRMKTMRLHGINRDIWDRFTKSSSSWEYDVIAPGFKYNMPDINAAIGIAQLERVDEFRDRRQKCAEYYLNNLSNIEGLKLPSSRVPNTFHSWHLFPLVLDESLNSNRDSFIKHLNSKGIGTSVHYKPLHHMSYYKELYNLNSHDFPNSEKYWKGCLSLPIYPSLADQQLEYIVEEVNNFMSKC